jgi:biotin transport system substrate-specific component
VKLELRDYPRIAIFVGLIAALGLVPWKDLGPIPFSLQVLGVMLAGAVLGSYRGTLAVLMFEVLVLAGLPILTSGAKGIAAFVGPTAGFLYGFLFGVWVIGYIVENLKKVNTALSSAIGFLVGGIGVIYAFGLTWLYLAVQFGLIEGADKTWAYFTATLGLFLVGDLIKAVIAVLVVLGIKAAYPKGLAN